MGNLLNMSGGSLLNKGLPYDAEIEYLESTGTQYISTGILSSTNIGFDVGFWDTSRMVGCIIGGRKNYNDSNLSLYINVDSPDRLRVAKKNDGNWPYDRGIVTYNNYVIVRLNGNNVQCISNNVESSWSFQQYYLSKNFIIYLFACNNDNAVVHISKARIYYTKIYDGNVMVRDYIPVRVGNVGYMYDKVSGQLFGNAGTGAFILGPDKTN